MAEGSDDTLPISSLEKPLLNDPGSVQTPALPENSQTTASGSAVGCTGDGRSDRPVRKASTPCAADRPSAIAHTTSEAPRTRSKAGDNRQHRAAQRDHQQSVPHESEPRRVSVSP